jgi:hypothetical protein
VCECCSLACATAASATNSEDDAGVDGQSAPFASPGVHEPKKYHRGRVVPGMFGMPPVAQYFHAIE